MNNSNVIIQIPFKMDPKIRKSKLLELKNQV